MTIMNKSFFLLSLMLSLHAIQAKADASLPDPIEEEAIFEDLPQSASSETEMVKDTPASTSHALVSNSPSSNPNKEPTPSTEELLRNLADQVETLESKAVVDRALALSIQTPRKVRVMGSRTIYNYKPDAVYQINTAPDHVTDIQLEAGESLTSPPTSGDTVRWNIGVMKSGQGTSETTHLILKALDSDIETNIIVATTERVYHLKARSVDWHMPAVLWNYPIDHSAEIAAAIKKDEEVVERKIVPENLYFDYKIDGQSFAWKPIRVFDDGEKTFIQMPTSMRVNEAPALFLKDDESEPILVNYRVKGSYYILDRLFERAELRLGRSKAIQITAGRYRKNLFERIFG